MYHVVYKDCYYYTLYGNFAITDRFKYQLIIIKDMSEPIFTVNKTILAGLFKTLFADRDFLAGDLNLVDGESIDITIHVRVEGEKLNQTTIFHRNKKDILEYDSNTETWISKASKTPI